MIRCLLALGSLALLSGCLTVTLKPVEVNVHATVDVNVKVDKALDDFFGDLDKKSATINTSPAKP
ncbi:MAG: hypothetical protein H7343_23285 [Undibacterium sp.]|nr:hypothetical protein [Opitutaceae bacterium]